MSAARAPFTCGRVKAKWIERIDWLPSFTIMTRGECTTIIDPTAMNRLTKLVRDKANDTINQSSARNQSDMHALEKLSDK